MKAHLLSHPEGNETARCVCKLFFSMGFESQRAPEQTGPAAEGTPTRGPDSWHTGRPEGGVPTDSCRGAQEDKGAHRPSRGRGGALSFHPAPHSPGTRGESPEGSQAQETSCVCAWTTKHPEHRAARVTTPTRGPRGSPGQVACPAPGGRRRRLPGTGPPGRAGSAAGPRPARHPPG